jgi:hypothetical protein
VSREQYQAQCKLLSNRLPYDQTSTRILAFPLSPAPVLTSQVNWLARISPALRSRSTSFQIGLGTQTKSYVTVRNS